MTDVAAATALGGGAAIDAAAQPPVDGARSRGDDRVRLIVRAHYESLWRWLRRLGVHESSVEDAAQQVLCVVARRIDDIAPDREKTFVFGVALRVAQAARREQQRRPILTDDDQLAEVPSSGPDAGEALDDRRARALLDEILESMPLDLRSVFILYELEEMTMAEIAIALGIPPGTVASRLRRAREMFEAMSRRVQARGATPPARRTR
jgi:RNA polymerase sigma-70 factor (ECF subfamily)